MDDICELEGICENELTEISDLGKAIEDNETIKESFEESHPIRENILNQEEFSVNFDFGIHKCENEGIAEEKKDLKENNYRLSPCCEVDLRPSSNDPVMATTITEDIIDDKDLLNGQIVDDLTDISSLDEELNNAIDRALEKQLDIEEDYDSSLSDDADRDSKEASAQTPLNQFLTSNESCPICRLQKIELKNNLTALCLEYPPYKKRKINKSNGISTSTSEIGILGTTQDSLEDSEIDLRRKKTSSEEQIVPNYPSETERKKGQNLDISSRSIRIGLSKRAKLRPLHQQPKLQVQVLRRCKLEEKPKKKYSVQTFIGRNKRPRNQN